MRKAVAIPVVALSAVVALLLYANRPYDLLPRGSIIDSIVVEKSVRQLRVYAQGRELKAYPVTLGKQPIGHKVFEGDKRTPEGRYSIFDKTTHSRFHKNLGISYPNDSDWAVARKPGKPPGGDVKIHGLQFGFIGRLHRSFDWTAGCIALTNQEMDDIYEHTPIGTPIVILP